MEYLVLIIPIIAAIILAVKFREQTMWWEYGLLLIPSIIIVFTLKFSFEAYETSTKEYLSFYYVKARHTDEWNEWIHKTCTRRVPNGRDSKGNTTYRTETYDCSYCQTHPERWILIDNTGNEIYTNKTTFDRVRTKWKAPMIFVDMNRHYYTKDGDAQDYYWDKQEMTAETYTVAKSYSNKIRASRSVFNFKEISKNEAKELGLYDYPEIINDHQNPLIGYKNPRSIDINRLRYINAFYGKTKQFRTFVIVFYDKPASIAEMQRSYWFGGNKNEFVTCVGINSQTNEVDWVNVFNWLETPKMNIECEYYFSGKKYFDPCEYADWIHNNINQWQRREFKDFDYLEVELSDTQYMWMFIITLIYSIGISIFIVMNNARNDEKNYKRNRYRY